jgi:hypothetical protein
MLSACFDSVPKISPSSCWQEATSWWCLSTFMPMRFIVDSISERMSWPASTGGTGK